MFRNPKVEFFEGVFSNLIGFQMAHQQTEGEVMNDDDDLHCYRFVVCP